MIDMFLYDEQDEAKIQFVGFVGEHSRYDLTLIYTDRHYGKQWYSILKTIHLVLSVKMT